MLSRSRSLLDCDLGSLAVLIIGTGSVVLLAMAGF
jgi:hypothetical protein